MSENQVLQVIEELGTDKFYFVGKGREEDNMECWSVYQTEDKYQLFAVDDDEHVIFEVYEEDGEFLIY